MIKLLAISGSPTGGASTDFLLEETQTEIIRRLGAGTKIQSDFVKLNDLEFIACQACGQAPTPDLCFFHDDLDDVYKKLVECDCLLMGSPIYFDTVSAQTKLFIDRCNCFRPPDYDNTDPKHDFIKLLKRKRPGAIILVGGERGYFEGARRVIAGFFKWVEVVNEGVLLYRQDDFRTKGTARSDTAILEQARDLGHKLAESITLDD